MADHLKLLTSLSVGSWYQNIAFYTLLSFFMYLNYNIISLKRKAEIKTSGTDKPVFGNDLDLSRSAKY